MISMIPIFVVAQFLCFREVLIAEYGIQITDVSPPVQVLPSAVCTVGGFALYL